MMEKSRSNFSWRLEITSFKAMIEFGWSLEWREVFSQLENGRGAVDRESSRGMVDRETDSLFARRGVQGE